MRYWNIRPVYSGRMARLAGTTTTFGFYADSVIVAFAKAHKHWPMAIQLVCESAEPPPDLLKLPATMTY